MVADQRKKVFPVRARRHGPMRGRGAGEADTLSTGPDFRAGEKWWLEAASSRAPTSGRQSKSLCRRPCFEVIAKGEARGAKCGHDQGPRGGEADVPCRH